MFIKYWGARLAISECHKLVFCSFKLQRDRKPIGAFLRDVAVYTMAPLSKRTVLERAQTNGKQIMAKVKDNPITQGLSGKLGKRLFFRHMRNGTTVLCTVPDFSNRVFSTGQLAHQSRFQQASAYAKAAAKTNPLYAGLAPTRDTNAYNLALSVWFHAPVIHAVTRQDGRVCVDATDNVQVASVRITILDKQGQVQAQGQAAWVQGAR